jgi:transcriptional regulator EpsA
MTLASDLRRLQLDNVAAHGIPDRDGRATSFFSFSKISGYVGREHATRLELMVPYLHAAWAQTVCELRQQERGKAAAGKQLLTVREAEVLNWVEQGKSNGEIAQILSISHLTVKNHMQKILRKLDVHNRAQAVARGMRMNLSRSREQLASR